MERDGHHPMKRNRGCLFKLALARESVTITCIWQLLKGSQGHGELPNEKGKKLKYAPIRGCLNRKAGGEQTRSGVCYVISLENISGFLRLILHWRQAREGDRKGKLACFG